MIKFKNVPCNTYLRAYTKVPLQEIFLKVQTYLRPVVQVYKNVRNVIF